MSFIFKMNVEMRVAMNAKIFLGDLSFYFRNEEKISRNEQINRCWRFSSHFSNAFVYFETVERWNALRKKNMQK